MDLIDHNWIILREEPSLPMVSISYVCMVVVMSLQPSSSSAQQKYLLRSIHANANTVKKKKNMHLSPPTPSTGCEAGTTRSMAATTRHHQWSREGGRRPVRADKGRREGGTGGRAWGCGSGSGVSLVLHPNLCIPSNQLTTGWKPRRRTGHLQYFGSQC